MQQHAPIRFCRSADGMQLAYSVTGSGPALLIVRGMESDDDLDGPGPSGRRWLDHLSRHHACVRFDARGCGLSQRGVDVIALDGWSQDIDAVLDAAGFQQAACLAFATAAAAAVHYAAGHPQRITKLAIYGGYARGRLLRQPDARRRHELLVALDMLAPAFDGNDEYSAMFREMFYKQHVLGLAPDYYRAMDVILHRRIPGDAARAYGKAAFELDVSDAARQLACRTLVLHARRDPHTPFAEGARLAGLIPQVRFVPVDSGNHELRSTEPVWDEVAATISAFLNGDTRRDVAAATLTARQREVLGLVSRGMTDKQIARELALSPRTVEMHVAGALRSLDCATRAEAVHRAAAAGLLTP
jgi:pimeloyl-ACP methyl ester carboxylesterase/DNA-binding CsgD family transcriptional regulator